MDYDYIGSQNIRTNAGIAGKVLSMIKSYPEVGIFYAWLPGVDQAGHYSGEDSTGMTNALTNLDDTFKSFLQELEKEDLLKDTAIILTSDHGMSEVIDDEYFLEDKLFFTNATTQTGLDPIIAVDAPLCYLYFEGETNTTKVEEFATYLEGEEGIEAVYVNEENADIELDNDLGEQMISNALTYPTKEGWDIAKIIFPDVGEYVPPAPEEPEEGAPEGQ